MKRNLLLGAAFLLSGFIGMGLYTLAATLYTDHQVLWQIVAALNKGQTQSQPVAK